MSNSSWFFVGVGGVRLGWGRTWRWSEEGRGGLCVGQAWSLRSRLWGVVWRSFLFFSSLWSDRMDGWIRVTGGTSQPDDGYVQFIFNCFSFRPTYTSTGASKQDGKHVLLFCPSHQEGRAAMIKEASTTDYQRLLSITKGIRAAGRWLARLGALY